MERNNSTEKATKNGLEIGKHLNSFKYYLNTYKAI